MRQSTFFTKFYVLTNKSATSRFLKNLRTSWKLNCFARNQYRAKIYLFKINNRNIRKRWEICSKLIIKTPEWRQWRRSDIFTVNFEHISHLFSSVSIVDFKQVNVSKWRVWWKFIHLQVYPLAFCEQLLLKKCEVTRIVSNCNRNRTHNHLVCKRTFSQTDTPANIYLFKVNNRKSRKTLTHSANLSSNCCFPRNSIQDAGQKDPLSVFAL